MSRFSCQVCAHPMRATVDELVKMGEVYVEGRDFHSVSKLLVYLRAKHPDYNITDSNVTRHKQNGHIPVAKASKGKSDLAVVYRDAKLFHLQPDGTETEIEKRDVKEALQIIAAVGVYNILNGRVTMTAKETVEVLKKLADMDKGTQLVDEYQEVIIDYLRKEKAKVVEQSPDVNAHPTTAQGYLDQLRIRPPEEIKDIPLVQEAESVPIPSAEIDDGRDT